MSIPSFAARFPAPPLLILALAVLFAAPLTCGQPAPEKLEPFVTTATRTPVAPRLLGTDVQVITAAELDREQIASLQGALSLAAAAPVLSSGAAGSTSSLFLRGANSNQVLLLVDGIRLNDPNTDYQAFLGGATLGAGDRLEIARGPQSTLYGAEAIGGVISLSMTPGSGAAASRVSAEGGSFGTVNAAASGQGASGADAWNFSVRGGHTDNDRPNNRFDSANLALRLDHHLSARLEAGGTLRWYYGELGSPGDRYTNDPNDTETESNALATAFVDAKFSPDWTAHVILGGQDRRYVATTPAPNLHGAASGSTVVTNRRGVLDAQMTYAGIERHRFTAGLTTEVTQTRNTGFGDIDEHQDVFAAFAQDEFSPTDRWFFTAGLRTDDFDTFGRATTGRATVAWMARPAMLKLRASYGTGFRSPSFLDLYGRDPYYVGNPALAPERSRGVDVGADYYLPAQRGAISVTWFQSDFTNLIDYNFAVFPSTTVNVGRARTDGLEVAAALVLTPAAEADVSYTYLDARSLLPGGRAALLRRPRHAVSADLRHDFVGGVTAGVGVQYVGRRADVDAATFATVTDGGYSVARVYAAWRATSRLTLKARLENALDRRYEPVNGYPALGLAAFAGLEYSF
jgi:vitamin B12 transporter